MGKYFYFILALTVVASCLSKGNMNGLKQESSLWKGDSIVTKEGNFYQLIFSDSNNYKIRWGNKQKVLESEETFELISTGPILTQSSGNAILLTQSCGTSCIQGIILLMNPPKDKSGLREFMPLEAYSLENELIAYVPQEEAALIILENFLTGKKIEFETNSLCPAALKEDCIDSCSFLGKQFYIKWQGEDWEQGRSDLHEETVDVSTIISN